MSDWGTFGVAALTGFFSLAGSLLVQRGHAKSEKRSVRAALMAEVAALKEIVELRGYLSDLQGSARELRGPRGDELRGKGEVWTFQVKIPEKFNLIYQANLSRLGVLSEHEATQIVRFHQIADSLRIDITEGGRLYAGSNDADDFDEAAQLLEIALAIAKSLTEEKRPWWSRKEACGQNVDTGDGVISGVEGPETKKAP